MNVSFPVQGSDRRLSEWQIIVIIMVASHEENCFLSLIDFSVQFQSPHYLISDMLSSFYGISMLVMKQLSETFTVVEFKIQDAFWD